MGRVIWAMGLCLLLGACAVGVTIDYKHAAPELTTATKKTVAVEVVDARPYVLAGDNTPQWVGMFRGGFGNPWGVHTASGDSFASDVAVAVAAGLRAKGVDAVVASSRTADQKLERTIKVTIKEWKSDTMYNTLVLYDLDAKVLDGSGATLASNEVNDRKVFNSFGDMPSTTTDKVVVFFKNAVAELLDSPKIEQALL